MGIVMQLLIETCEFPNNTSPGEYDWQGREQTRNTESQPELFVNHAATFSSQRKDDRMRTLAKSCASENGRDRFALSRPKI
jgi:hypothetical protein